MRHHSSQKNVIRQDGGICRKCKDRLERRTMTRGAAGKYSFMTGSKGDRLPHRDGGAATLEGSSGSREQFLETHLSFPSLLMCWAGTPGGNGLP